MSVDSTVVAIGHDARKVSAWLAHLERVRATGGEGAVRNLAAARPQLSVPQDFAALEHETEQPDGEKAPCLTVLRELFTAWTEVDSEWPDGQSADGGTLTDKLKRSVDNLSRVENLLDLLDAERALRDILPSMRYGQALDVRVLLGEGVEGGETRARVLSHLRLHERELGCIVDPSTEQIYRVGTRIVSRVAAALWPLIAVAVGWLTAVGAGEIGALGTLHLNNDASVTEAYLLVLAGAVLHVIVAGQKVQDVSVLPVSRTLDWCQVRWAAVGQTVFAVVVTLIGLKASGVGVANSSESMLLLSAGYGASSLAGLFLVRFDSRANTIGEELKGSLATHRK